MSKWRSASPKVLNTRPIYEKDWPRLIEAMKDDDCYAQITSEGIIWYSGRYVLKPKSVRDVWELSVSQMRRLHEYILVNDPFDYGNPNGVDM